MPSILLDSAYFPDTNTSIIVVDPPSGDAATDTANIQAAIDAMHAVGGGAVILQTGGYIINITSIHNGQSYGIMMKHGVMLNGVSKTGTILVPADSDFAVIMWDDYVAGDIRGGISSLGIIQQDSDLSGITGILMGTLAAVSAYYHAVPFVILNDISIGGILSEEGVSGIEVAIQACSWKSTINECRIETCQSGIRLEFIMQDSPYFDNTNCTTISNCYVAECPMGIYIRGLSNIVTGSAIRIPENGYGVYIDAKQVWDQCNKVLNNYIEVGGGDPSPSNVTGVYVGSPANVISSNFFDIPSGHGVFITFGVTTTQGANITTGNFATTGQTPLPNQLNTQLTVNNGVGGAGIIIEGNNVGNTPFLTFQDNSGGSSPYDPSKFGMRYDTSTGKFYLGVGDAWGFQQQVAIDQSSGNVGIGTASPSEKLEVSGNIKVDGFLTAQAGASGVGYKSPLRLSALYNNSGVTGFSMPGYILQSAGDSLKIVISGHYVPSSGNAIFQFGGSTILTFPGAAFAPGDFKAYIDLIVTSSNHVYASGTMTAAAGTFTVESNSGVSPIGMTLTSANTIDLVNTTQKMQLVDFFPI